MSRVAIVIVGHQVHRQLPGLLAELPRERLPHVILVDDGSSPPLVARGVRILRHPTNQGYGAAQKTGFRSALALGYERVVLLHGDGQYPAAAVLDLAEGLGDVVLGSRFLHDGGASIPRWRRWGNRLLTTAANHRFHTALSELHTGARAYGADFLRGLDLDALSDDYLFDHQVLVAALAGGAVVRERPMPVRYDPTVQSITPARAVRYALGCTWSLWRRG